MACKNCGQTHSMKMPCGPGGCNPAGGGSMPGGGKLPRNTTPNRNFVSKQTGLEPKPKAYKP